MAGARKAALVTGSGKRRIGWTVAEALAGQGYDIALHYRTSVGEAEQGTAALRERGVHAIALAADLRQERQARDLVRRAHAELGRLDVLVTCAAVWTPKRLEDVTADDVRHFFEANTLSTFVCCQEAGLLMVGQPDGGCIVTLGDWAIERPYLNYAAYFPSKGAIPTLTRAFAVELGSRNPRVRVNCLLPGPVLLPADLPPAERAEAIRGTLVKREGEPRHVAQAVLALVENDFITGACLPVDGGRSIYAPER